MRATVSSSFLLRRGSILALAGLFLLASVALGATRVLDRVTTSGASAAFDNRGNDTATVHVWCASSASCNSTVTIETTLDQNDEPWVVQSTLTGTDMAPPGVMKVSVGANRFIRVNVTNYNSGDVISASIQGGNR